MELAYISLHQLCAPMLDHLDRLPLPQREALTTSIRTWCRRGIRPVSGRASNAEPFRRYRRAATAGLSTTHNGSTRPLRRSSPSSPAASLPSGSCWCAQLAGVNVGKEPIHFSDENQALVDTKGKQYSPDDEAWIYMDDSDPYAEINPGNTLRTTVPFGVSKRAKPDYLLLKAGVFGFSEGVRVKLWPWNS
jgi:hypothetical protein